MDMKRFFLYAIVIAALALAGCGGNGGGTAMGPDPDPDPMPMPTCPDGQVGTPPNCMDPAPTMEDAIAAKKAPAIADPDGDGMLGENDSTTAANDDIDNPMRPGKMTETADNFSATAGGVDTPAVIAFGDSGTAAEYDRLGMDDSGNTNEFEMTESGMVDGFAMNVYTRTVEEVTMDTVTVFDNRDAPKDVEYGDFYSDADAGSREAVTSAASGVLNIDETDIADNGGLFYGMMFPSGDSQTYTYVDGMPDADPPVMEQRGGRTLAGMFNGVPGEFACSGTTCSATSDTDGNLMSLVGDWTFTPDRVPRDADPHMVRGANYDSDYLAFGYWLRGTTVRGETTYSIGTFVDGGTDFPVAGVSALMGSATYSGVAGGMFVMKTDIDGDNMGPVATSAGKFTADTTLTAKFGDSTMTSDDFTISGTVDNFQLTNYDGSDVANDWSLNLNRAAFATHSYSTSTGAVDGISAHANTFSGTTSGMEDGTDGRWDGQFYGPQVEDDTATTTVNEAETGYPTGVAGEFIGHFESGHAIGAYGAELE